MICKYWIIFLRSICMHLCTCIYYETCMQYHPFRNKETQIHSSRWNWWSPSNPKYLRNLRMWNIVKSFPMNGRKRLKNMLQKLKKIQTTWHNYSEDLENSTISIEKNGLLLSLALKTAPLKGPQMQAASLHLISTNGRARRSMVFYGVLMCSLLVRFHANVLDVVNVVMSNPWMSMVDLGTLGSSKWWISKDFQLGYQGGMYLSNEEQHDPLNS